MEKHADDVGAHGTAIGEFRAARRTGGPTPSAIGGAILGGLAVGMVFGPLGAIAGFVVGGLAGEVFERQALAPNGKAGSAASQHRRSVS
jgi:hypothetical protein